MNCKQPITGIAAPLVAWYQAHERHFPWRENPSPYRVWVSEIMLQQTRIEAALPYFERFMTALPTICDLAEASDDLLLKLWEGLGYYSRVRNLQKAARQIMETFDGELPGSYEQLLSLAGIGEYTAGAIASIAFGKREAAVDGNVLRVMARLLDDDSDVMQAKPRKRLSELVKTIVPAENPGDFNQGLMELGETICLPNAMPHCHRCPIHEYCAVAGLERAKDLPTRAAPKPRRVENRMVLVVVTDDAPHRVLLHRRPAKGLLGGMWELPNILVETTAEQALQAQLQAWDVTMQSMTSLATGRHVFSHVEWNLSGVQLSVKPFNHTEDYRWVTAEELQEYALPTAFKLYAADLPKRL